MSRVGKNPITIPAGIEVSIENNLVTVKGPKGTLTKQMSNEITISIDENVMTFTRSSDEKNVRALHGLTRNLVNNMVIGVKDGYEKTLILNGVGYKANKQGNKLVLALGYSHPIEMVDPAGIETVVPDQTTIIIKGIDKEIVGQHAAVIRSKRPPEPYKGKGVKYKDEVIRRKAGKSAKK